MILQMAIIDIITITLAIIIMIMLIHINHIILYNMVGDL